MATRTSVGPLLLFVWMAAFAGGSALLGSPWIWGDLEWISFFGAARDTGSLWVSFFRCLVGTGAILAVLYGIHRLSHLGRWIDSRDFSLLAWFPACGIAVSLLRVLCHQTDADLLLLLEPALMGVFFPLALWGTGSLIGRLGIGLGPLARSTDCPVLHLWMWNSLLGAVALSTFCFGLAYLGLWSPWVLWGTAVGLGVVGLPLALREVGWPEPVGAKPSDPSPRRIPANEWSGYEWVGWVLVFTLLWAAFQLSCLPPDESDELRYHLSLPKRYLESGGWVPIPDQAFAHFPLGLEMLFALPLSLDFLRPEPSRMGWVCGPKMVHFYFFLLTLGAVKAGSGLLKGKHASSLDWIPVWILATLPFAPVLASWAFVDFASGFGWIGSAVLGTWLVTGPRYAASTVNLHDPVVSGESSGHRQEDRTLAILIGVSLGWGLMVKYTSLAWCGVFAIPLWVALRNRGGKDWPRLCLWIVLIPAVLFSPILIGNALQTGNPFYPLLSGFFGSGFDSIQKGFYDWHAGMKGGLNAFWSLPLWQQAFDLVTLPMRAALFPLGFENNAIGGMVVALLPLALAGCAGRFPRVRVLAVWTGLLYLLWALTYRDPRFAIPLWGMLAILMGLGWRVLFPDETEEGAQSSGWKALFFSLILVWGFNQGAETYRRCERFRPAIWLAQSCDTYLEDRLPNHRAIREVEGLRKEHRERPRLLVLGNEQTYYFDSPFRGGDYFDGPWLAPLARKAETLEEMSQTIRDQGIDWVFINRGTLELNRFNLLRGILFTLPENSAAEELKGLNQEAPGGPSKGQVDRLLERGNQTEAFRRMQAWLVRHPGFKEIPLEAAVPSPGEFRGVYSRWVKWPEFSGQPLESFPNTPFSLLVPVED